MSVRNTFDDDAFNLLFSKSDLVKLREVSQSDPWMIARLILTESGAIDSKPLFIDAGFELEEGDDQFYLATKVPAGWSRKTIADFTVSIVSPDKKIDFPLFLGPIPEKEGQVWFLIENKVKRVPRKG